MGGDKKGAVKVRVNKDTGSLSDVSSRRSGDVAIVYAGDYLNKLSGERIEREATRQLEAGCKALVVSFKETQLVNSIGVSILLGIIDAAAKFDVQVVFSDLNAHTVELFDMLGLSRHARLMENEQAAIEAFQNPDSVIA
jgi:anti-anti-sigma regulatory factor